MRLRPRLALLCAAALALPVLPGAPASAEPSVEAVSWEGRDCHEVVVRLSLPPEQVDALLPEGYRALRRGYAGMAGITLTVLRCTTLTVDGVPQDSPVVSDAFVLIEPPAVEPRASVYQLWQLVGSERLHAQLSALGLLTGRSPGASTTTTALPTGAVARGDAPWELGGYTLDVAAAETVQSQKTITSLGVHEGPRGRLLIELTLSPYTQTRGLGTVRTEDGGRLAAALGRTVSVTTAPAGSVLTGFDVSSRTYLD